ncbi:MAG: membrane protein insertase YidC [Muribaculaceae bacterium]|nr:membrane protein insertase YidC [Muribaculaceae bacterium]
MDKNTITGLVLMAVVMFGFMWLSKPEAPQSDDQAAPVTTETATDRQQTAGFMTTDSAALVAAVINSGTELPDGTVEFTNENLNLRISGNGLEGTFNDGTASADINSILTNSATSLTPSQTVKAAKAIRAVIDNSARYEGFARHLSGENKETVLENELVRMTLSSRGAQLSKVELKKYDTETGAEPANVVLFTADTDNYGFCFNTADQRIDTREFNFTTIAEGDSAVRMELRPTPSSTWGIRYSLSPDSYVLSMEIYQSGMGSVLPANTATMDFGWKQKMVRNELGRTFEERNSAIYYKYIGESVDDMSANSDESKSLNGRLRWVAFKNQFFSSVLIARDCFNSAELKSEVLKNSEYLKNMSMTASLPYTVADGTAARFDFYLGPNDYPLLSSLDDKLGYDEGLSLTRLIPLGWGLFRWINTLIIIPVFTFLGHYFTNYGIIILLLTIFIKIIIFPFTFKSFKSQAKMRVLAPEIKEINEKYPAPEDAAKRSTETMALYSRAGASPFSGCLPMMLQMPVLIAMFSFFPSAIELRGQSFLWAHDLSAPDFIFSLPFSIPFYGDKVSLFCLLMTVINILYMRISMQNQPQSQGMPGMKMMQYFMPVMFLFIFNDYASGLSYYYLLSLLITIIQTYIFRHVIDEKKVREQLLANARKPKKKSGWMARLEEAQRQAQAAQRANQNAGNRKRR